MKNNIGIRIKGSKGIVLLDDFIKASSDLLELISEIDISVSPTFKPTVDWKLTKLSYSSPATLEAEPVVKEDQPDNRSIIIDTMIDGMESLKKTSRRPNGFSDKALETARNLAKVTQNGLEEIEIYSDEATVIYTFSAIENINTILKPVREVLGTIEGRIERLNSHLDFVFHVYEPILQRRIKCELLNPKDLNLKNAVISYYEQNVMLTGLLFTNINGEVNSAKITDIKRKTVAPLIKDASEVTGIWDFTDGIDPVLFVKRGRDDN